MPMPPGHPLQGDPGTQRGDTGGDTQQWGSRYLKTEGWGGLCVLLASCPLLLAGPSSILIPQP